MGRKKAIKTWGKKKGRAGGTALVETKKKEIR